MNKIYFAYVDEDMGGTFISAPNLKIAKKLALNDASIALYIDSYIDLKCHCVRDENNKIKKTNLPTKILTIQEILQERCHWWNCYNCEQDEYFEYAYQEIDGTDYYKCPKCGGIYYIPYAGL
ncbi:hypothetical protein Cst_c03980 [Thermoclostridium stercorarium subsp. stercorarium DSM 8532]|uniref:Uncharacterized protein n=1 Tax=Thermoclostridium stercorarium (strain ATCC 35414 / DSM 8532 / NCIMB 11754) TaxID=1121335 RepID=L7VHB8_THES1|nr:hypothetical protein [Thermoclostridium stercorarium]AGC67420.1 hypothetical protein Cst_c03980 [Thermoclostridium stercorarium subsp. stercorarium DSM 8532]AGI38482.1 hypothetical protein Clst_0381 [Thermoclostridium stercorarium subsp. stercorarium DSM 8532]